MDFRLREFVTCIVVVSYNKPNALAGVICKYNLETSWIVKCYIYRQVFGNNLGFLEVPECSFSGYFFRHDQIKTDRNNLHPTKTKGQSHFWPRPCLYFLIRLQGSFQLPVNKVMPAQTPLEGGCKFDRVNSPPPVIPVYFPVPPT